MRFTCFILAASLGASPPACAEFAVVSPQPAAAGDPPPAATASSHSKPRHAHPHHPRQPVVVGFGDQAPLSFAVRQIVPAPLSGRFRRIGRQGGSRRLERRQALARRPFRRHPTAGAHGFSGRRRRHDPNRQIPALTSGQLSSSNPISFAPRPAMLRPLTRMETSHDRPCTP